MTDLSSLAVFFFIEKYLRLTRTGVVFFCFFRGIFTDFFFYRVPYEFGWGRGGEGWGSTEDRANWCGCLVFLARAEADDRTFRAAKAADRVADRPSGRPARRPNGRPAGRPLGRSASCSTESTALLSIMWRLIGICFCVCVCGGGGGGGGLASSPASPRPLS